MRTQLTSLRLKLFMGVTVRLIVNMERWRWMPEDLGPLYVWSNTPEFMLYVIKYGKTIFADKTQVGTSNDPTPVLSTDMTTIVFNPEWIAPGSVLVKDLLPRHLFADETHFRQPANGTCQRDRESYLVWQ
jgi:murein L,D-transpeptidase YcbB/YkuD